MSLTPLLEPLQAFLSGPAFERTRRNHGLEHATVTLLTQKLKDARLAGRSTPRGFYIYGPVDTGMLSDTAHEALKRLQAGDAYLAVHPNCGTNLVTSGLMAGLAAYLGMGGSNAARQGQRPSLSRVALFSVVGLLLARPAGTYIQEHVTTSADVRDLRIAEIERHERGGSVTHFVRTEG